MMSRHGQGKGGQQGGNALALPEAGDAQRAGSDAPAEEESLSSPTWFHGKVTPWMLMGWTRITHLSV